MKIKFKKIPLTIDSKSIKYLARNLRKIVKTSTLKITLLK